MSIHTVSAMQQRDLGWNGVTQQEQVKLGVMIRQGRLLPEPFTHPFIHSGKCKGYCGSGNLRRVALTWALDGRSVEGVTGQVVFGDFDEEGNDLLIGVKGGRGIAIAENAKIPVITEMCVVCCCSNLAAFIMECRREKGA